MMATKTATANTTMSNGIAIARPTSAPVLGRTFDRGSLVDSAELMLPPSLPVV